MLLDGFFGANAPRRRVAAPQCFAYRGAASGPVLSSGMTDYRAPRDKRNGNRDPR